jgi:hypothetical protein
MPLVSHPIRIRELPTVCNHVPGRIAVGLASQGGDNTHAKRDRETGESARDSLAKESGWLQSCVVAGGSDVEQGMKLSTKASQKICH